MQRELSRPCPISLVLRSEQVRLQLVALDHRLVVAFGCRSRSPPEPMQVGVVPIDAGLRDPLFRTRERKLLRRDSLVEPQGIGSGVLRQVRG